MKLFRILSLSIICAIIVSAAAFSSSAAKNGYYRGDANCDDQVSVGDATTIQKYLAGIPVTDFKEQACDVDKNDVINISDAEKIQRYAAKFDDPYKIGSFVRTNYDLPPVFD